MSDETPNDLSELDRPGRTVEWTDSMILLAKAYLETHSDEEFRANPTNVQAMDEIVGLVQELLDDSGLEYNDATLYHGLTGVRTAFIIAMGTLECAGGEESLQHLMGHYFLAFNHYFGPVFEAMRMNEWLPPEVFDPDWRPDSSDSVPDLLQQHLNWIDEQDEEGTDPDA